MAVQANPEIKIAETEFQAVEFGVIGKEPLILSRMSEKARHELLLPKGRKTAADKASSLKHDPYAEFAASAYQFEDPDAPTLLYMPGGAFKSAMMTAALDLPGARKAQIGRLVWIDQRDVPIYGVPRLFMAVTRSADMNKTPDIRTRVIVPVWAAVLKIQFVTPMLTASAIANLLHAAGLTAGVGDWRNEKGKGIYGQFTITEKDDPELLKILNLGRTEQLAAMEQPEPYDQETTDLLSWFDDEVKTRGRK